MIKSRITSRQDMVEVIRETIIRFNRDTAWLATGVVGTVLFAAIVLAVQEHQPNAKPGGNDLSVKANPASMLAVVANGSSADTGSAPTQESSVDRAPVKASLDGKDSSSQKKSATSGSDPAFTPEAGRHEHSPESTRRRGSRSSNERNRPSVAFGNSDVKKRLIELWHQSLAKNDKSRSWTAFSHLNRGVHNKAAYTAEMSH
jgi:hypothetical protein